MRVAILFLTPLLASALTATVAAARPAQCETTDDGAYPCDFRATDREGSFVLTARGKPDYTVVVSGGIGSAFVNLGPRDVALAGPYRLERTGAGCWVSVATRARICAK